MIVQNVIMIEWNFKMIAQNAILTEWNGGVIKNRCLIYHFQKKILSDTVLKTKLPTPN